MNRAPYDLAEKVYKFVNMQFATRSRDWISRNTGRKLKRRRRRGAFVYSDFKLVQKIEYEGRDCKPSEFYKLFRIAYSRFFVSIFFFISKKKNLWCQKYSRHVQVYINAPFFTKLKNSNALQFLNS